MKESEYAKLERLARDRGMRQGRESASWLFDGNTTLSTYREWLRLWDECDLPDEWMPRAPLAGTFHGESPKEVLWGILDNVTDPDDETALCDAYEEAYYESWYSSVEATCADMVGESLKAQD